jgi:hypothetical protein
VDAHPFRKREVPVRGRALALDGPPKMVLNTDVASRAGRTFTGWALVRSLALQA